MDLVFPPRLIIHDKTRVLLLGALLMVGLSTPTHAVDYGPNVLPAGNFEAISPTYVPWAGVDDKGILHGLGGQQISVADDGTIGSAPFSPSLAVADMNGDGKPDIVMADSTGFFWYYPNSGTPEKPAFTQGEVIPIWLGEEVFEGHSYEGVNNYVPRIQLIDLSGQKKFDVVAGTYAGKFFHITNIGSGTQPLFKPTIDRDHLLINTHRRGVLWCNYLAPYLTGDFGSGGLGAANVLDLIMGEGTYSANSIYLLHNTGSNDSPTFDEDHLQKIIPGYGLEQIEPVVIDWNNDGKSDVICGSRTGQIVLYLNNSTDPSHPTFAPGVNVTVGGLASQGSSVTIAVCDLTNNKLPNLLLGKNDGTVWYALNTGKLGSPQFTTPLTPVKGILPPDYHYIQPTLWRKDGAWGAPDELIACVNAQAQPGFTFPEGSNAKYALKFSVWPVKNICFPQRYYPPTEDWTNEHTITSPQGFSLKLDKRYRLHFWLKTDGDLQNFRVRLAAGGRDADFQPDSPMFPESAGSSWTEITETFRIDNRADPTLTDWGYNFEFRFNGQATFYVSDIQIQQELN